MMKVRCKILILMLFASSLVRGQETWSLEKCIDRVLTHSLELREGNLNYEASMIRRKAAPWLRLPTLGGNSNINLSFGRQIDPTTNDFNNQRFTSQNMSVSSALTLFNGGRINSLVKQSKLAEDATVLENSQLGNEQALSVARAYLQVLMSEENVENAEKSLILIEAQLQQIDKFIEAGTRPRNERLDLIAQMAQAEQVKVEAMNEVELSYLALKQMMQLSHETKMRIQRINVSLPSTYDIEVLDAEKVYLDAKKWQPSVLAGEIRRKVAELDVSLMRAELQPSITLFGSVGSRFSSLARRQGRQTGIETIEQDIFLNGESVVFSFEEPFYEFNKIGYRDQVVENLDYGVGINLTVPIYSQGRSRANLKLAELDVARAANATKLVENQLKTEIQTAVTQVKAGKKQYQAAQRTVEAMTAAFVDAEKQYKLGVINSLDYITAQNNRDQALVELTISKYDYLFRLKILDFYNGKELTL